MNNCKINSVIQEMKKGVVKIIICKKHFFKSNTEEIQGTGFLGLSQIGVILKK